jgi:hypothetical protein
MAAERKNLHSAASVAAVRRIMKPVISTDVMGNRNVEVKAVGARAEPALFYTEVRVPDAVVSSIRLSFLSVLVCLSILYFTTCSSTDLFLTML